MSQKTLLTTRADYSLDAPTLVQKFLLLKPGGKVALMDFEHVKEYGEDLRANGMLDMQVSGLSFWIYPPVRIATARKG